MVDVEPKLKAQPPKLNTDLRAKNRHQLPSITTVDVDHGKQGANGSH